MGARLNQSLGKSLSCFDSPKGNTGQVSALAFLNYYRISFNATVTYTAEWNNQEQMLIIDLI